MRETGSRGVASLAPGYYISRFQRDERARAPAFPVPATLRALSPSPSRNGRGEKWY